MTEQPTTSYPGFGNYGSPGRTAPSDTRPTRRPLAWNGGTDIGLLLLRLGIGGVVFAHGAQKVFGLWGGTGIAGFATNLDGLRLPAGDHAVLGHRASPSSSRARSSCWACSPRWRRPPCSRS